MRRSFATGLILAAAVLASPMHSVVAGGGPLPSPHPWFAPGMVPVLIDATGGQSRYDTGMWLASLDGTDARQVAASATSGRLGAGRTVIVAVADGDGNNVRLIRPEGVEVEIGAGALGPIVLDADRDSALYAEEVAFPRYRIVQVNLLDGSTRTLVPDGQRPIEARLSPDERWVAWTCCFTDQRQDLIRYRGPSGRIRAAGRGDLIGFDALGRLWFVTAEQTGSRLYRIDPGSGRRTSVMRRTPRDLDVLLGEDGRTLISLRRPAADAEEVVVRDLVDGDRWRVDVPVGSQIVDAGARSVLLRTEQDGAPGYAVLDLLERWAAFVPNSGPVTSAP